MSDNKYTNIVCVLLTVVMVVVTVLFMNGKELGITPIVTDGSADEEGTFSARDLDGSWDGETAEMISLGDFAGLKGGSAYELDGDLHIISAGTYVLSGEMEAGKRIYVEAAGSKVQIVLAGVTIRNTDRAPLYVKKADKLFLTLAEGTNNVMELTETLCQADEDEGISAALYCKSDLSINGAGSLTVKSVKYNGVRSSDDLIVTSGTISVDAGENALVGRDSLRICGGMFDLTAGKDGMKSNYDGDKDNKGYVVITDGTFTVKAVEDGIQAETDLTIEGGTFALEAGKDGVHANRDLTVNNGNITLAAGDDGFHADKNLTVNNGEITITASTEGIEGNQIVVNDGVISLKSSDDGFNASGGSRSYGGFGPNGFGGGQKDFDRSGNRPDRDGNWKGQQGDSSEAAGAQGESGNDSENGQPQPDGSGVMPGDGSQADTQESKNGSSDETENELPLLEINGGIIHVDADGDGLDSNGNIVINGGTIYVDGPTNGGNGALDSGTESGGTLVIHGGTIIALGASGMVESFCTDSTQMSLTVILNDSYKENDLLMIQDSEGRSIFEYTIQKSGSSVVFSSPDLKEGAVYTIKAGTNSQEATAQKGSENTSGFGFGGGGGRGFRGDFQKNRELESNGNTENFTNE